MDERTIYDRFAARIRMYGLRHLRNEQAARDLVQMVLLAVVQALREGRVQRPDLIDEFVLGAARNILWDIRRSAQRQKRVAEQASAGLPEWREPEHPGVDRIRLEGCLQGLEPRERAVVTLTFAEDLTAEEIGTALKVTAGNVRVIRHRALARLRSCMEGGGP